MKIIFILFMISQFIFDIILTINILGIKTEKIIESLDNEIKTLQNIIDFDNDFDYWDKEIYCLEILKKIRKGEIIK